MKCFGNISKFLSAVFLILIATVAAAQSKQDGPTSEHPKLRIQMTSNKAVYKPGETILITLTLRNEGQTVVWIDQPTGLGRFPGDFYVDAVGPDGKALLNKSPVMSTVPKTTKRSKEGVLKDFLCQHVPLLPGEFWGFSGNISDAYISPEAPGQYKIIGRYNVSSDLGLSRSEFKSLQTELRAPIQTEPVVAEPLFFEIQ